MKKNNNSKRFLLMNFRLILMLILFIACSKDTNLWFTETGDNVVDSLVTINGEIIKKGSTKNIEYGFCYSEESSNPTISKNKITTKSIAQLGKYSATIPNLYTGKYYYRSYLKDGSRIQYGNTNHFHVIKLVTQIIAFSTTSVTCKTSVPSGSGINVSSRGICWSSSQTPNYLDYSDYWTKDNYTYGDFTSVASNLLTNTKYYLRAFVYSTDGDTYYGNTITFITKSNISNSTGTLSDNDGNTYNTVKIGNQTWMAENLKTTKYSDGTYISYDYTGKDKSDSYCYYNDNSSNLSAYGALYNWYAVNTGKLCPTGWHVPSESDWKTLDSYCIANGYNFDGTISSNKYAKSLASVSGWTQSDTAGNAGNSQSTNNSSGFDAYPSGGRLDDGNYMQLGNKSFWWTSDGDNCNTTNPCNLATARVINSYTNNVASSNTFWKVNGLSVRCLKN